MSGVRFTYIIIEAINAFRAARRSNPANIELAVADAQAISDYQWLHQDRTVRPAKSPVLKIGDTAHLWGVPLTVTGREPGVAILDGMQFDLELGRTVVASRSVEQRCNVGKPPTSNMSSHTLAKMLLAHADGPVLVLFDNQAGVARELYVLTQMSDAPEWADPSTIYIDTYGG